MPKYAVLFLKTSLIYLLFGTFLGFLILSNKAYSFSSKIWLLLPIHIDILIFGWFLQFIFGVAFWIMPRFIGKNSYGNEKLVLISYILINLGIFTRFINRFGIIVIFLGIIFFISNLYSRVRIKLL
jgi:heme/copper-type cytochrome/quinol oxidase subunit 1